MTFQSVAKGVKFMATWNKVTLATMAKGNKFLVRTLEGDCSYNQWKESLKNPNVSMRINMSNM